MQIFDGRIFLDEGETFIEERQDERNIMRIASIKDADGHVTRITRHFSEIGPNVIRADCSDVCIELNRETGTLKDTGQYLSGRGWRMKRREMAERLLAHAEAARVRAQDALDEIASADAL